MNPAFHPPGDQEALQPVDLDHGSSSSLRLENVSAAAAKADPCSVARAAGYRPAYNSPPAGYRAPTAAAAAVAAGAPPSPQGAATMTCSEVDKNPGFWQDLEIRFFNEPLARLMKI